MGFFRKKNLFGFDKDDPRLTTGDDFLKKNNPHEYLSFLIGKYLVNAKEVDTIELLGHLHTCIDLGAAHMVSTLAQLAMYHIELQNYDNGCVILNELEKLATTSASDALSEARNIELQVTFH